MRASRGRVAAVSSLLTVALVACWAPAPPSAPATPSATPAPSREPVLGFDWSRAEVPRPADAFSLPDPTTGPAHPNTAGHPGHFPGQAIVADVAVAAEALAAVGFVGPDWRPVMWRADDPRRWELVEVGRPVADEAAFAVAVAALDGGGTLAVGRSGRRPAAWRSDDGGASWSHVEPAVLGGPDDWERMTAVAAAGRLVVAGGSVGPELLERHARFWTSADGGLTWTPAPDDEGFADAEVVAIVPLADGWLALGRLGTGQRTTGSIAWRSPDARAWRRIDDPALADGWVRGATIGPDGTVVAVGSDRDEREALVWTSADGGATWQRAPSEPSRGNRGQKIRMTDVTALDGMLYAVGNYVALQFGTGAMWRSADGVRWERAPYQVGFGQAEPMAVVAAGPGLVAVGSSGAPDNYIPRVWLSPPR